MKCFLRINPAPEKLGGKWESHLLAVIYPHHVVTTVFPSFSLFGQKTRTNPTTLPVIFLYTHGFPCDDIWFDIFTNLQSNLWLPVRSAPGVIPLEVCF